MHVQISALRADFPTRFLSIACKSSRCADLRFARRKGLLAKAKGDAAHAEFQFPDAGYFLSRQTLVPSKRPGMALWREKLFAWRCHVV
ncbi:KUP/HAK/KT family potassium transporter [Rhizobium leguminosarum]|uniref:KUP/HAK/KT family potassium transporter n=1 Tax=Rhizobium leguminosarum TaxID=384 RepID=UPI003CC922FE